MKVYKFGGASVKDPDGIRNLAKIVEKEKDYLIVVVSAFGKTTNALERVLRSWLDNDKSYRDHLEDIYSYHASFTGELFPSGNAAKERIDSSFSELGNYLKSKRDPPMILNMIRLCLTVKFGQLLLQLNFLINQG